MNKKHWITVVPRDISEDLLAELIDDSWHQVVNKLSKRRSSACVRDFQPNAISVIAFSPLSFCDLRCTLPLLNAPVRCCKREEELWISYRSL